MATKILKFGGSSVQTPERIQDIYKIIQAIRKKDRILAVVFSAFGGVTDQLIALADLAAAKDSSYLKLLAGLEKRHLDAVRTLIPRSNRILFKDVQETLDELKDTLHGVFLVRERSPKSLDFIMSFGERLSCRIISEGLKQAGIKAEYLDTRPLIKTDDSYNNARVDFNKTYKNIRAWFKTNKTMQIATGFIGSTNVNETTTLGRGGSDFTASILAAALSAAEVQIWTDVDGVMTADPRKVKKAFPIESMTYNEAMEMSHFGAKVIHPPTMEPASARDVPIRIKNTFHPEAPGTLIRKKADSAVQVKGISSIDDVAILRIQGSGMIGVAGISHRLFGALAREGISVTLISQASSEHSICIAVNPKEAMDAKEAVDDEFSLEIMARQVDEVIIERNMSIIALVGENMQKTPGIAGRCFDALGKNGVNIIAIAQGSSELNISIVINRENEAKALNALHEAFFLSDTKSLHVFQLGTGQIGSTLLKQIHQHREQMKKDMALVVKIVALGNVDKMAFDEEGIPLNRWNDVLKQSKSKINVTGFIRQMIELNLPNTVFVDCTGSPEVVSHYQNILNGCISIVTPNKIANSGPYRQYKILREAARKHGIKFLYETNVGAGLPIISTLKDLISSGDRILKIEAVLSGTISYIFNTFSEKNRFSDVVKKAQAIGLSEPDPRDDLNGVDVLRKILILARETGLALEPRDIKKENILPAACRSAGTIKAFYKELEKADVQFEEKRKKAAQKNRLLRYMAVLEKGKARIALEAVDHKHPFYALSGSDNMIVFTTERYQDRPLVIKGPGAGKDVTAAGVFADIIRVAGYYS